MTETSYQLISGMLQSGLEKLEEKKKEGTVKYYNLEKAQQELDKEYWGKLGKKYQ